MFSLQGRKITKDPPREPYINFDLFILGERHSMNQSSAHVIDMFIAAGVQQSQSSKLRYTGLAALFRLGIYEMITQASSLCNSDSQRQHNLTPF